MRCKCGCGRTTNLRRQHGGRSDGKLLGGYNDFVQGHYLTTVRKTLTNAFTASHGPAGTAGHRAQHQWMARNHPKTGVCEECGKRRSPTRAHDYASIGHTYTYDRADWRELCSKCHKAMDGGESN